MIRLGELGADQVEPLLKDRSTIVVLPVGSVEQHCRGPIGADSVIAERVAELACEKLESSGWRCVVAPPIEYGFSAEWAKAPGTLSLSLATFTSLLKEVVSGLIRMGAVNVAVINGHYGNSPAIEAALRDLMPSLAPDVVVVHVNYWEALDIDVGHAAEAEAEVMRALGYTVDFGRCACEVAESPRGVKVYRNPVEAPAQLRVPAKGELTSDYIGAVVGSAVERGIVAARGNRRPLP